MKIPILASYQGKELPRLLMALTLLGSTMTAAQVNSANPKESGQRVAFPLKVSANHRYMVDQKNMPFLMVGDRPQGLMSQLTEEEADSYFADRQAHGFNAMGWIDVTCAGHDFPDNEDSHTVDGILPFTGYVSGATDYEHYNLGKPSEAYFTRLDHIVMSAERHGILVFLDPMETNGWLPTSRNNGSSSRECLWTIPRQSL